MKFTMEDVEKATREFNESMKKVAEIANGLSLNTNADNYRQLYESTLSDVDYLKEQLYSARKENEELKKEIKDNAHRIKLVYAEQEIEKLKEENLNLMNEINYYKEGHNALELDYDEFKHKIGEIAVTAVTALYNTDTLYNYKKDLLWLLGEE